MWRSRPVLERERQGIRRQLDRDLDARRDGLAADPPDYLVGSLGPRPGRAAALWDAAAARIDQHREAFNVLDEDDVIGPRRPSWDPSASRRASGPRSTPAMRSTDRMAESSPLSRRGWSSGCSGTFHPSRRHEPS